MIKELFLDLDVFPKKIPTALELPENISKLTFRQLKQLTSIPLSPIKNFTLKKIRSKSTIIEREKKGLIEYEPNEDMTSFLINTPPTHKTKKKLERK